MTRALLVVACAVMTVLPASAAAEDSVAAARELYATAAYDEALAMLDRLRAAKPAEADARPIEQVRAYCFVALGRTAEAEQAAEAAIVADPKWELAETEAPPRIVSLFTSVRARVLPELIRQRFTAAKSLYTDRKHTQAVNAFSTLLELLDDPGVARVAGTDLTDLRTVVAGFRDLAVAAGEQAARAATPTPPPAAPSSTAQSAPPGTGGSSAGGESKPSGGGLPAGAQAEQVQPPGIISQQIPYPVGIAVPVADEAVVILDVLIDEFGRVERAAIRQSANRAYEAQLLSAARTWRYTPATQGGKPVKYVKTLEITLTPR